MGTKGLKGEGDTLVLVETNKQKPIHLLSGAILIKKDSAHLGRGSCYKEYYMDVTLSRHISPLKGLAQV